MYGVRNCPEGQAYYDSIIQLYADWGVDFIKCDDICNTDNLVDHSEKGYERKHEIEMLHRAIQKAGRPMVLSLSPGPAIIQKAWHYKKYANMWRITDDLWDDWALLKAMFPRCEIWQDHIAPGCYPDCDMLPLGKLGGGFGKGEWDSRLTPDEQRTMMTLWCLFGSPLMLGAELTKLDQATLALLTNRAVLAMLPPACRPSQRERTGSQALWTAENDKTGQRYAALFNLAEEAQELCLDLTEIFPAVTKGRELWTKAPASIEAGRLSAPVPPHGCVVYEVK